MYMRHLWHLSICDRWISECFNLSQIYKIQPIKKAIQKFCIALVPSAGLLLKQRAVLCRLENESQNPSDFIFCLQSPLQASLTGLLQTKKPNFRLAFHSFVPYGLQRSNFLDDLQRLRILMNSCPPVKRIFAL